MFAAAQVFFSAVENPITLPELQAHLQGTLGGSYELVEWQGFRTTIPQLQVTGNPGWTLQIEDDPDYVPEEIEELVEEAEGVLAPEALERLRRCNVRLDAMASQDQQLPSVSGGPIGVVAATSLDPSDAAVRVVLLEVARLLNGLVYDLVEGKWMEDG